MRTKEQAWSQWWVRAVAYTLGFLWVFQNKTSSLSGELLIPQHSSLYQIYFPL